MNIFKHIVYRLAVGETNIQLPSPGTPGHRWTLLWTLHQKLLWTTPQLCHTILHLPTQNPILPSFQITQMVIQEIQHSPQDHKKNQILHAELYPLSPGIMSQLQNHQSLKRFLIYLRNRRTNF